MVVETIDWTDLSFQEARQTLKKWRDDHARRSEEIVEIWEHVLSRYTSSLHDELWAVLEQVTIAAIDSARHDVALQCLQKLMTQFPSSSRVAKLQAMRLEALKNYDDAEALYNKLIKADETNPGFRKRKVAILIAKGEKLEAIRELNEYLEIFINDTEAWIELSELYLKEADYARAAFAFEDVLLSTPHSSLNLRRIAEIRYAQGGQDNLELAKAYYDKAIQLNPDDTRSLFGVVLVCNQLANKASPAKKKELIQTGTRALDKLASIYKKAGDNPKQDIHQRTVNALRTQLSQS
uniref:ER membrane protein complex subunit 2 n=1 Tax=Panagrellus redivivus TaxID=6233 RepID=A0A7E4WB15_PANRE